jgi:hypothetical protein
MRLQWLTPANPHWVSVVIYAMRASYAIYMLAMRSYP